MKSAVEACGLQPTTRQALAYSERSLACAKFITYERLVAAAARWDCVARDQLRLHRMERSSSRGRCGLCTYFFVRERSCPWLSRKAAHFRS
jgi:hypothetical protein